MPALESTAEDFRRWRRRALNQLGKTIFRGTDEAMARASRVGGGPIYDPSTFAWTEQLAGAADDIRAELEQLLVHHAELPRFQDLASAQGRIADDDLWRVFAFYGFGVRSDRNCALCPATAGALDAIPGVFNAFFSILGPGKHIARHSGVTRGFLRCHLGLIVPDARERCHMDVDGTNVVWRPGEVVVFDDSRPHEVWNDTDQLRAVLLFDVPRPMALHGRLLLATLMRLLGRTYYVQEPLARQRAWEERTNGTFVTTEARSEPTR